MNQTLSSSQPSAVKEVSPSIPDHEMLRSVGRGAYGEVWLARSVTGAFRAVKIVRRTSFENERPFRREFEGILKFEPISRQHDSQVDILHVGSGEDYFYYVMELADDQATGGQINPDNYQPRTIKSDLLFRPRLPFEECVSVGIALATALEHLHQNGLVHRDVKPSNIIFVNGVAKLADIGLVTGMDMTRSYVGTEGFAAPEGPGTAQADIFSLGKVLYEMSTGKDRQEFPELPTELMELPEREGLFELNAVVARACRHDPRDRYSRASEMRADLELLQSGKSLARLHRLEVRLRAMKRLSVVGLVVTILAIATWLYQARQTRIVRELSERSQLAEKQSREALASLQVENGAKLTSNVPNPEAPRNNLAHGLAWYAKALANVQGDPVGERAHRLRIAALLDQHPKLLHQFVHPSPVFRSAFTPDGGSLITHSAGDEIRLFDLGTGQLKYSTSAGTNSASRPHYGMYSPRLGFSSDGKRMIVRACDPGEETHVYNVEDGRLILPSNEQSGAPIRILDCLDGRTALVQDTETTARLVDLDTGRALSPSYSVPDGILSGRLTPDAEHLALLSGDGDPSPIDRGGPLLLQVWRAESATALGPQFKLKRAGRFLLSADGCRTLLDVDSRAPLRVLNTATGEEISTLQGRPNGFYITSGNQWVITELDLRRSLLFNFDSGGSVTLNRDVTRDVDVSPDGLLLATAHDTATAHIWNHFTGQELPPVMNDSMWSYGVAFSPDGEVLATCSVDRNVRVWDLASVQVPRLLLRQEGSVYDAAFSPGGEKIVTLSDELLGLRIWDSRTGRPLAAARPRLPGEVHFSPDGRILLIRSRSISLSWSLPSHKIGYGAWLYDLDATTHPRTEIGLDTEAIVTSAEFDSTSKRVVTVGDGRLKIWDARTGELLGSPTTDSKASGACFFPSTNLIAGAIGNSIQVFDANSGGAVGRLLPEKLYSNVLLESPFLSPDGRYLAASGSDQSLHLWDVTTGKAISPPLFHAGRPVCASFSRDAQFVMTFGRNCTAKVWKVGSHEPFLSTLNHEETVFGAEFSFDRKYIGTSSLDGYARLWDFASGQLIRNFFHGAVATAARFHPHTGELLTAGWDGRVCVWAAKECEYSVEQVASLADVLLSNKMDSHGSLQPIPPEQTKAQFQSLLGSLPEAFRTTMSQKAYWHEQMAMLARDSKLWNAVISHISRALELEPTLIERPTGDQLLVTRGHALAELGRFSEAETDFGRAVQFDASHPATWEKWGIAALAQNKTNLYGEICQKAFRQFDATVGTGLTTDGGDRNPARMLASFGSYPGLAEYTRPLRYIEEDFEGSPDADAFTLRGKLRYRVGKLHEAFADLEKGHQEDPETHFCLAMALHGLGKHREALDQYQRGVERSKRLAEAGQDWAVKALNEVAERDARSVLGPRLVRK